jgi:hypothetical protein
MIIVKASAGVLIELAVGPSGRFDALSVRLSEGLAPRPFHFEASQASDGRLLVKPLEAWPTAELTVALGVVAANESNILAEVQKYSYVGK